jgi:hypothetical protein
MQTKNIKKNKGFLALMSAIIISVILLLIATNLSFVGFYTRFNILDTEMKERSSALADSCIDAAQVKLTENSSYAGNVSINVSENTCFIGPITISGTEKIFTARGIFGNSYTNLKVHLNSTTFQVVSVEEITTY